MNNPLLKEPPSTGEYHTLIDPSIIPIPSPIFRSRSIPNTAKMVYAALALLVNGDKEFGLDEVAEICGTDPLTCQDAIRFLMAQRFINYDEEARTLEIVKQHPIFIEGYLPKETGK